MNPGKKLDTEGERITVPNVRRAAGRPASRVVVSKSRRTVIAYGAGGRQLAQYPATIGGPHDPLPIGHWTITVVVHDPWFNYDPERFWNADPKKTQAVLPPGPDNPAGAAWIGTSKEHYGIHGTPDPGYIRHGESAGCIRMTNWDVFLAASATSSINEMTPPIRRPRWRACGICSKKFTTDARECGWSVATSSAL